MASSGIFTERWWNVARKSNATQGPVSPRDQAVQERLEALRSEYEKLSEKRIQTQTMVQNLEEQLQGLREKAEAEYGTSDLEKLEELLEQRRQENERRVTEYQQHIEGIKDQLKAVETETREDQP